MLCKKEVKAAVTHGVGKAAKIFASPLLKTPLKLDYIVMSAAIRVSWLDIGTAVHIY